MNDKKNMPEVIDADYSVVGVEKQGLDFPGGFKLKERDKKIVKGVFTTVVKPVFYFMLWSVRQVGSLMIDGISGTIDGVKEAADKESKYDSKKNGRFDSRFHERNPSGNARRKSRPIWYIPTKEEEEAERMRRY